MTNTTDTTTVAFDAVAFRAGISELNALRETNKAARSDMKLAEGKAELKPLFVALDYTAQTFDFTWLAVYMADTKPSAIAKRIIKAVFPSYTVMVNQETKALTFVRAEGKAKVAAQDKLQVLRDAFNSGDSINCDQIKAAFPDAPQDAKGKVLTAIAKRINKGELTKADIVEFLKTLG